MTETRQVRRPLVGIACSMVVGLSAQHWFGISPLLLLGMAAVVLAWSCRATVRGLSMAGVFPACALLAAAAGSLEHMPGPAGMMLPRAEVLSRAQDIIGRVDEPASAPGDEGTPSFRFRAEAVRLEGTWYRSDTVLRVYFKSDGPTPEYGEQWWIHGRCWMYEKRRAGGEGSFSVRKAVRLQAASFSFRGMCYRARERAARYLYEGIDAFPEHVRILHALLLGYRKALPPELYKMFAYTGTLHVFAISGLHVGVMASILIAVLKMTGVSRPKWGLLLIPALFFYVVSTGMKPSAFRAFVMAAVYFAAPIFGRRPDVASSIALAAVILLCMDPLQISDPGFLLSFTVVSGIVMVHGYAVRRLSGFSRPGWTVPLARLSGPRPAGALVRAVGLLALTSVAAWLFSAPLSARCFNTVSPVAIAGNLVVIPVTFMIVLSACLSLLAAPVSLVLTGVFNHASRVFVSLLVSTIRLIGTVPEAYRFVRSPSWSGLVFWYAGLVLIFTGTARLRRLGLGVLAASLLICCTEQYRPFFRIEIHREGAAATAVRLSRDQWVLITDGQSYSVGRAIRLLQKNGVNRLDALVVGSLRAEADAVRQLYAVFRPEQVWLASAMKGRPAASTLEREEVPVCYSNRPGWAVAAGTLTVSLGKAGD